MSRKQIFRKPIRHYADNTPKLVEPNLLRLELTHKYFVDDISIAATPGTRLHNILEDINQSRPLSEKALLYLREKGVFALQQLAQNEISYEAFCKIAVREQHDRKILVAEAERQKSEADRLKKIEEIRSCLVKDTDKYHIISYLFQGNGLNICMTAM